MMASTESRDTWRYVLKNFAVISCIIIAESLASTSLLPFVYFMVRDFGYDESQVGARAGLITSAFFTVQMFSTPAWCIVSNHLGRRPTLLAGLFGSAIGIILFGLSKSLVWAIAARALCGLLNGNLAIARTMVGEIAERAVVDNGRAFSLFGFCLAFGWVVGPLIGGTFANPGVHLGFDGPGKLFLSYPWLLPCLLSAVFDLIVFVAGYFLLSETLEAPVEPELTDGGTHSAENDSLLAHSHGGSYHATGSSEPRVGSKPLVPESELPSNPASSRRSQAACLLSATFYFIHLILFDELFSLFAASSLKRGIGLSFQPRDISTALAFAGPAMCVALLVFPWLHRRVNFLSIYRWTAVLFILVYPLFSLLPGLGRPGRDGNARGPALWGTLLVLINVRYSILAVALTSLQITFNDIVKPHERALMNGLAQSVGSFARAVGPTLGGVTWSWSSTNGLRAPLDFHACFWLLSILGALQFGATLFMSLKNTAPRPTSG